MESPKASDGARTSGESVESSESAACAAIERLIREAAQCSWGDSTRRVQLLRDAFSRYNSLVVQILDIPAAKRLVGQIREGYRRTRTANTPDESCRGRSLRDALGSLEAAQVHLVSHINQCARQFFDSRVNCMIQQSKDNVAVSNNEPEVPTLSPEELHVTVEFLATLLSFLGQLCMGSSRAARITEGMVPASVITSLLRLPHWPNWRCTEWTKTCEGLCCRCRVAKQIVFKFILRAFLQPKTGCCGRCPSGSGRVCGYAGLNVKWTCDCSPSCLCFYRSANCATESAPTGLFASTPPSKFVELQERLPSITSKLVGLEDLRLPALAAGSSPQNMSKCPLSRESSLDSITHHYDSSRSECGWKPTLSTSDPFRDDLSTPTVGWLIPTPLSEFSPAYGGHLRTDLSISQAKPSSQTTLHSKCTWSPGRQSTAPCSDFRSLDFESFRMNYITDLSPDVWEIVGKCIADDLQLVVQHVCDPSRPRPLVAPLINYAMRSIAPCVVKCHPSQIGVSNLIQIHISLKQLQASCLLPEVVRRCIQGLILLVRIAMQPQTPHHRKQTASLRPTTSPSFTSKSDGSTPSFLASPATTANDFLPKLPPFV